MKKYLYLLILLLADSLAVAADVNDSLLNELDKAIDMRPTYIANKERAIRQLHRELKATSGTNQQKQMEICDRLASEYAAFNTDSSLFYADLLYQKAVKANDAQQVINAKLHKIETLTTIGRPTKCCNRCMTTSPWESIGRYSITFRAHSMG